MATKLPQSTLHSSGKPQSSPIFVGGLVVSSIALGGILAEGGHYVGERNCPPRVELCAPNNGPWLPEGSEHEPANPLGRLGTGLVVAVASTLSPTSAPMPLTAK